MSEIGPGRLTEALIGPLDPERRRASTAAPENAFADLLRTFGTTPPLASAEAFEANDIVGRAELSLVPDSPEAELHILYREPSALMAHDAPACQIDQLDLSQQPAPSNAASAAVDIRAYAIGPHRLFAEATAAAEQRVDTRAASPALTRVQPESAAEFPELAVAPSKGNVISGPTSFAVTSSKFATPATTLAASPQPPQPPSHGGAPAAIQARARREPSGSSSMAKSAGNAAAEKMRHLVPEHIQSQANSSAVHVAVLVADTGLRVVARVGAVQDTERTRLKESITAMLVQHGFAGVDIVIQTSSPAGAGSRQG